MLFTALLIGLVWRVSRPLCDIPIEIHNYLVFVSVQLNADRRISFLFDSGVATPVNILDSRKAAFSGLGAQGSGQAGAIGGKVRLQFTDPLTLSLGACKLSPQKFALIDLSGGQKQEG